MASYRTIRAAVEAEIEVSRSRFRCFLAPVSTEDVARELIAGYRREFWDARHVCSAFVLLEGDVARSNDDGEPAGTAGAPMLAAVQGAGLSDVVVVVVRWFGGVLLGTGGLTRAYGDSVRAALELASVVEFEPAERAVIELDVASAAKLENAARRRGLVVEGVEYADRAMVTLSIRQGERAALEVLVAELTAGQATVSVAPGGWLEVAPRP